MAFWDNPIIDQYARNEEKSEWRLREFLNQETGFICRREVPDKGCDLDVELVLDSGKSSSWKFPVQLKSIENLHLIKEDQFISLSFDTSRLGYLMRRIPAMGLVVLYSVKDDQCFYEYVDKIYSRLMEERESEEWKKRDGISIHVPVQNRLNAQTVQHLHQTFVNRFEQAMIMQNSHGEKYGLPSASLTPEFQYDFHNPQHIAKFLSEYGILLLNNYDLDTMCQMVFRLTNFEIYRDKTLLLVAAVAYAETGLHAESKVFCDKLAKQNMSPDEDLTVSFVNMKNELALGYITTDEFIERLNALNKEGLDGQHIITIEINAIHYQLAKQKALQEIPLSVLASIEEVFERIETSNCRPRTKGLLILWNCDNLSYYTTSIAAAHMGRFQIRNSLGNPVPLSESTANVDRLKALENRFQSEVAKPKKIAAEQQDPFLQAYCLSLELKHFIHHHINFYSFEIPVYLEPGFPQQIHEMIQKATVAYNEFLTLGIYVEAYNNLCNLLEVIELATRGYGFQASEDQPDLHTVKSQMEEQFDFPSRPIVFSQLIERKRLEAENSPQGMAFLKDLSDDQLEGFARVTQESFRLPDGLRSHLLNEMKAYRMFYNRCLDPNIEVLQFRTSHHPEQLYAAPIRFILRNKSTGIQTTPSADMDGLLRSLNL